MYQGLVVFISGGSAPFTLCLPFESYGMKEMLGFSITSILHLL
jgi:hypothetical protein